MIVAASLSGCGVIGGMTGNKAEVCDRANEAFTTFGGQLATLPPTENAAWTKAADDFATTLDSLAATAEDSTLKSTLADFASAWRQAAPPLTATGDVTQLTTLLKSQPSSLGTTCS
ncbi:hypothetical protein [Actinocorallia lasiicapitis]